MLELSITIKGKTMNDVLLAMNEVSQKILEGRTVGWDHNTDNSYDFDLDGEKESKFEFLSIYAGEMGIYFWINEVVNSDQLRYKKEESFGISHNRTTDIEDFHNIMNDHGIEIKNKKYYILPDRELIQLLVEEFA